MTLVRFAPARHFATFEDQFERFFNRLLDTDILPSEEVSQVHPLINVSEDEDKFMISAELPGMDKGDIDITFKEGVLTISGEKKSQGEKSGENYFRRERSFGKFCRAVNLRTPVKEDKISAEYKNGVLNITVPKAEEVKPRKIEVKVK